MRSQEEAGFFRRTGDLKKKGRLLVPVTASPDFNGSVNARGGWAGWVNWVRLAGWAGWVRLDGWPLLRVLV